MNRSIIPVILYLTLSPIILSAQNYMTISGKVFDSETKMQPNIISLTTLENGPING